AELDFAREQAGKEGVALAGVIHGNALDLAPLPDAHFDAVLLMGPLYHLLRLEERQQAVREARRVLKPGGVMAASFIGRYSVLQDVAPSEPEWIIEHEGRHRQVLETGCLLVDSGNFVDAYLAHPSEVRPLMEGEGLQTMDLLAAEGLIGFLDQRINQLQGEQWEAWVDVTYRICRDPSILGAAAHLLWIGRK
ncbi:MAG TPA: class I SAM-dependent methyltransferase, partial [Symbiobacteriaceae bacterium]|nr:class I SAM-dependent methyltransferase [Symbiobacteriaceae bacterium]